MGDRSDAEVYDRVLDVIVELTESRYGYLYFYDEATEVFTLHAWSDQVLGDCKVVNPQTQYSLEKTGFWGEVVRQRRSLINNDFAASHPLKKGYPEGHAQVHRFMSVPILSGERTVAVAGVANKVSPYTDEDAIDLQAFCQGAWNVICQRLEHRRFLNEQTRYRQLFEAMPITCAVLELLSNEDGVPYDYRFVYGNQPLADLTGIPLEKITGRTAGELFPEDRSKLLGRFAEIVTAGKGSEFEYFYAAAGKYLTIRCYPAGGATFVTLVTDVTAKRKLMERTLRDEIESYERERFSRELHDSAGQTFQAIRLYLNLIEAGKITPDEIQQVVAQLDAEVADAFAELREIARILPADTDWQLAPFMSGVCLDPAWNRIAHRAGAAGATGEALKIP